MSGLILNRSCQIPVRSSQINVPVVQEMEEAGLVEMGTRNRKHKCPYFGKTYGPRQLRYVLFRLG
jgi:hypothetical protein